MANPKRQCATCHFFQQTTMKGYGWCTHPQKKQASGVRILVRERELGCRDSWGVDFWTDKELRATTSPAPLPPSSDFQIVNQEHDDQVTGIVDTSERLTASQATAGDDRVTHTTVRDDRDTGRRRLINDANDDAIRDQDERVGAMARGPGLALKEAWNRNRQRQAPPPAPDTESPEAEPGNVAKAGTTADTEIRNRPVPGLGNTPPVPREEVQATRSRLSPAVGPDTRFDSVPEIRADVELPLLRERGFTRSGKPASPEAEESGWERALRRAREFRQESAAHAAEPPAGESPSGAGSRQTERPAPSPQPTISREDTHFLDAIVWDVEPAGLELGFNRGTRDAESLPDLHAVDDPNDDYLVDDQVGYAAELDEPAAFDGHPSVHGHDYVEEYVADPPRPNLAKESKHSWWRGFPGIRRRRRGTSGSESYEVAPAPGGYAYDEREGAWSSYLEDDDPVDSWHQQDEPDDVWLDTPAWHDDSSDEMEPAYDAGAELSLSLATSEESWLQDERAFPEPQPAAWRESREAILKSSWREEPDLEPAPVPRAESVRWSAREVERTPVHAPPDREPMRYFPIDEPEGMSEFRNALFGAGTQEPESVLPVRRPIPERATHRGRDRGSRPESRFGNSGRERATTSRASRADAEFDIRTAVPDPEEDLRPSFEVASSVKKCCRTCRSFRQAEHGDRGWCANDHAFTHRQMVNADELPCRSTIGDWWLAADHAWASLPDDADLETPRTDRLLARRDAQNEPDRRDGRRVRTRKAV